MFVNVKLFNLHECRAQLMDNIYFCKFCNIVFQNLVRKVDLKQLTYPEAVFLVLHDPSMNEL